MPDVYAGRLLHRLVLGWRLPIKYIFVQRIVNRYEFLHRGKQPSSLPACSVPCDSPSATFQTDENRLLQALFLRLFLGVSATRLGGRVHFAVGRHVTRRPRWGVASAQAARMAASIRCTKSAAPA